MIARFIAAKVLQVVSSSCKPAKYCCRSVVADCAVDVVVVAVGFDGAEVAIDTDDVVGTDVELAVDADTVVGVDIDVTATSDGLDVGMRFLVRVRLFVWRICFCISFFALLSSLIIFFCSFSDCANFLFWSRSLISFGNSSHVNTRAFVVALRRICVPFSGGV